MSCSLPELIICSYNELSNWNSSYRSRIRHSYSFVRHSRSRGSWGLWCWDKKSVSHAGVLSVQSITATLSEETRKDLEFLEALCGVDYATSVAFSPLIGTLWKEKRLIGARRCWTSLLSQNYHDSSSKGHMCMIKVKLMKMESQRSTFSIWRKIRIFDSWPPGKILLLHIPSIKNPVHRWLSVR